MGTIIIEIPDDIDVKIQANNLSQAINELKKYVDVIRQTGTPEKAAVYFS